MNHSDILYDGFLTLPVPDSLGGMNVFFALDLAAVAEDELGLSAAAEDELGLVGAGAEGAALGTALVAVLAAAGALALAAGGAVLGVALVAAGALALPAGGADGAAIGASTLLFSCSDNI